MKTRIDKLGKVSITVEKENWNSDRSYDRLVIVGTDDGIAYISRCLVPKGVDITNREYWIPVGISSTPIQNSKFVLLENETDLPSAETDYNGPYMIGNYGYFWVGENGNVDNHPEYKKLQITGKDGKSAYEIYVDYCEANDNQPISEEQWNVQMSKLSSLALVQKIVINGEDNIPDEEGCIYISVHDGKSAYDVAVQQGFEGTVDEWLASLKGQQGRPGMNGSTGPRGLQGPAGNSFANGIEIENTLSNWENGEYKVLSVEMCRQLGVVVISKFYSDFDNVPAPSVAECGSTGILYFNYTTRILTFYYGVLGDLTLGTQSTVESIEYTPNRNILYYDKTNNRLLCWDGVNGSFNSIFNNVDVENSTDSDYSDVPLAARQGKILRNAIEDIRSHYNNLIEQLANLAFKNGKAEKISALDWGGSNYKATISYHLTGVTIQDNTINNSIDEHSTIIITLTAESHYTLEGIESNISIKNSSNQPVNYTYNNVTHEITIPNVVGALSCTIVAQSTDWVVYIPNVEHLTFKQNGNVVSDKVFVDKTNNSLILTLEPESLYEVDAVHVVMEEELYDVYNDQTNTIQIDDITSDVTITVTVKSNNFIYKNVRYIQGGANIIDIANQLFVVAGIETQYAISPLIPIDNNLIDHTIQFNCASSAQSKYCLAILDDTFKYIDTYYFNAVNRSVTYARYGSTGKELYIWGRAKYLVLTFNPNYSNVYLKLDGTTKFTYTGASAMHDAEEFIASDYLMPKTTDEDLLDAYICKQNVSFIASSPGRFTIENNETDVSIVKHIGKIVLSDAYFEPRWDTLISSYIDISNIGIDSETNMKKVTFNHVIKCIVLYDNTGHNIVKTYADNNPNTINGIVTLSIPSNYVGARVLLEDKTTRNNARVRDAVNFEDIWPYIED